MTWNREQLLFPSYTETKKRITLRASPRWMEYNVHIRQWSLNNRVCKQSGQ